jgi:2-haloacid dehalogenase
VPAPARAGRRLDPGAVGVSERALYVFDAYGTLFDVHSAVARLRERVGPNAERLSELWRSTQMEYSWVRSLLRRHADFWRLTEDALDFAAAAVGGIDPDVRRALLEAYLSLDPYAEVLPVLSELKRRGARLAILSNGSPPMLAAATRSAGLDDLLDVVLSVEMAGIFKPDPRVYQLVLDHFSVTAGNVSFQSSNAWDVAGAAAFGFQVVWVNRQGRPRQYVDIATFREASDLSALIVG